MARNHYGYACRRPAELVLYGMCAIPFPLDNWVFLVLHIRSNSIKCQIEIPDKYEKSPDPNWRSVAERVEKLWIYELSKTERAFQRAGDPAFLFGFLTSVLLSGAFMMVVSQDSGTGVLVLDAKSSVAAGVASAAAIAFTLSLGQILIPVAGIDYRSRHVCGRTPRRTGGPHLGVFVC